jgi:hypothetical protein
VFYSHSLLSFTSECVHNYSSLVFCLSLNFICFILSIIFYSHCFLTYSFFSFSYLTMFSFLSSFFFLLSFLFFNLISVFSLLLYFCLHICCFLCLRLYFFICFLCSFPLFSPGNRLTAGFFEGLLTHTYAGNVSLTEII